MDKKLEDDIISLSEEKYREPILKTIQRGDNVLTINFNDLSPDSRKTLNKNYIKCISEEFNLNRLASSIFNKAIGCEDCTDISLQFANVSPRKQIRELTSDLINGLIAVNGVIINANSPQSIIYKAHFRCPKCNTIFIVPQTTSSLIPPIECTCRTRKGFILLESESEWNDYQEYLLQEKPDEVKAGVIPRTIKMVCMGKQLIDKCKPGDIVDVTCALHPYKSKSVQSMIYAQALNVNNIEMLSKEAYSITLDDNDSAYLEELAEHPNLQDIIVKSIFPSIYEHDDEKLGMILSMFGGVDRKKSDISQRGTINILLIGDPSTAKTRMLQAVSNAAPKVIYTSGMGASGVGLTAAAIQDPSGWRLEAGALVLADGGICCIDEIEKMSDEDRVKIHEAMSKQTISIDKANIHTTLNARTSIIAAANPTKGRYDDTEYLTDNISLPPTILSRFDLIFIIRDIPDEIKDKEMAETIFGTKEIVDESVIDVDILKKYILYSKRLQPILSPEVIARILNFYLPLRQQSMTMENNPIAIAPRQLEGLRRLIEARARMFLRDMATVKDAEVVIGLMARSLMKAGYDPTTGKMDINIIESGKPKHKEDKIKIIEKIIESQIEPLTSDQIRDILNEQGVELEYGELTKLLGVLCDRARIYKPIEHQWVHIDNRNKFKYLQEVYTVDDDAEKN